MTTCDCVKTSRGEHGTSSDVVRGTPQDWRLDATRDATRAELRDEDVFRFQNVEIFISYIMILFVIRYFLIYLEFFIDYLICHLR